ncbi:MAG: carboxypeptidase-like regulatory domain-containing protein, partial [Terracidiphilus sp.]
MAMKKILALAALVACGLALPLFAQSDRATITGTVKDPSSAVLPGVRVQVINTGTDAMQTTATDAQGFYRVENLPVGTYTVSFSAAGFKTLERKGITLLISQVAE